MYSNPNRSSDVIIIPKSTHIEHIRQNIDIFDFELSADNMAEIAVLDIATSLFFDHHEIPKS